MKKLFTTLTLVFAISAFAMAQSNSTTSEATKATTTVNAADHSQSTNAADCTPEKMKECKEGASSSKSCCSSKSTSSNSSAASALGKEGDKAKTVSIGASAKKSEKSE
ncbi:MAG: hypothetical protein IPG60_01230 [Bacteroidetes bacterium]|nr:hypothetical protein [Bacteroidota bacterium]MBP7399196.1 hypothetical protein [Chitinophagales bacterium]MBK7108116.1 hypothetical protein [Bacteroidota bacterium]MBK8486450.1 hypothetical protein [Bacteroidota bacterium]MBK8683230.1 hypothetical protein [Bacteroidota bacterium]